MDIHKIGILGLARSGIAAAYKIKELGGDPFLSEFKSEKEIDESEQLKRDFVCEFGGHTEKILENKIIIVSPGIPLNISILLEAKKRNIKLISEIEFGYLIKDKSSKIIAITGSNGKSTTVSLIHHILQEAGFKSILAGNIGIAFTSYPIEKPGIDFIVLELSSFQLELIDKFKPDVAAVLNISPDHLNRYKNMDSYTETKFNIFKNQHKNDIAILNFDDDFSRRFEYLIHSKLSYFSITNRTDINFLNEKITYSNDVVSTKDSTIKGPHNIANIMAAILALSPNKILSKIIENSLRTFQPLPHRMEFVSKINGINFFNDSKATNTDSVRYALRSFKQAVRLIIGGAGKGEDYSVLNSDIINVVTKLYIIGEERFIMQKAFSNLVEIELFDNFRDAVISAFNDSKDNDNILLSPACTSYDMFASFEERGNTFKNIVLELKDEI